MKAAERNVTHLNFQVPGCATQCTNKNTNFFKSIPEATITITTEEPVVQQILKRHLNHESKPLEALMIAKSLVK